MNRAARRAAAGMGVVALAAGLTVAGAGAASAEPASVEGGVLTYKLLGSEEWVDFSRTVDKSSVAHGDTVSITTTLTESNEGTYTDKTRVQNFEDWTPACFEYQEGSGTVDASRLSSGVVNFTDEGSHLTVKPATGGASWRLNRGDHVTVTASYTVNCDPGQQSTGGFNAHTSPSSDGANLTSSGWLDERSTGRGAAKPPSGLKQVGPTIEVTQSAPADIGGLKVTPSDPNTNQKVTVSGNTSPNTEVTVTVDGREFTGHSDGAGKFSVETDTFAAGPHSATVTARNSAGTTDGTIDFTVSEAPTKPGTPSGVKVSPQPVHAGDTVTVSGKAAPGSEVDVDLGGKTCQATADANGDFACDLTAPDAPGDHQLRVTAANSEGASDAHSTSIPVNAQPTAGQPAVTVDPKNPQAGDSVDITITAPEGAVGKNVSVTVNGNQICQDAVTGADGRATCSTGPLEPGKHDIVVEVEGAESYSTSFVVAEPETEEPGDGNDGGNGDGGADAGSGSLGSLGFLDIFGSLGLK